MASLRDLFPTRSLPSIIGMTLTEASAVLMQHGLVVRATMRDNVSLMVTMDYRLDRINVAMLGDRIAAVIGDG